MARQPLYGADLWAEIQQARKMNRNRLIVHHLSHGHTVDEIAGMMHYSPHTVRWWIKWLYLETLTRNRAHLVGEAYRRGWLPLGEHETAAA